MTDTKRAFAVGDRVIARQALIVPPAEGRGVRLEIASASRGEVVDVRPHDYPKPYVVCFEVTTDVGVEVEVTADQLARIKSIPRQRVPDSMPPLDVREPHRYINRRALYRPTKGQPHQGCKVAHAVNMLLLLVAYGCILALQPVGVALVTLFVVMGLYGHHLQTYREWVWFPEILRHDHPLPTEELVISEMATHRAYAADLLFCGLMTAVLTIQFISTADHKVMGPVPFSLLLLLTFGVWSAKAFFHELAVQIHPKTDN